MRNKELFLLVVLFAALFVRGPYVFQESVWNDETVYMWLGDQIISNPFFLFSKTVAFHSYGYLLDISTAVFSIFTSSFYASRVATLLASLFGVFLTYKLASELTNEWGGLACGLILAFNPQHIFFSVRSLTDVWLATTLTLFTYFASKYEGKKEDGFWLGVSAILVMMSRVSGVLVIGLSGLFIIRELINKRFGDGLVVFIGMLGGLFVVLMGVNFLFFGSPLQFGGASLKGGIFTGSRTYYIEAASSIYSLPVFVLALLGTYFALKEKKAHLVAGGFLTYFLWFSLLAGEKVPRYVLQTIPLAIVLAVFGLYKIVELLDLDRRLIGAGVIFALLTYSSIAPLVGMRSTSYVGFLEAGQSIKELDDNFNFSKIYAQSTRQIRAFSGIEYTNDGGKIRGLPEDINAVLNETNILLEIDVWEYTGPTWVYPLDQQKLNTLLSNNFTVMDVIEKDVMGQNGIQNSPVSFILAKLA